MKKLLILLFLTSATLLPTSWHQTPLMLATQKNDLNHMQQLIAEGADVNAICGRDFPHAGNPVLRYAIDNNAYKAVHLLLQAGANVNEFSESGLIHQTRKSANTRNFPLLAIAIKQRASIKLIQLLIAAGADIEQTSMFGHWTPLMVAAYYGHVAAVIELLRAGANPNITNKSDDYRTALDYAQEMGYTKIACILKEKQ